MRFVSEVRYYFISTIEDRIKYRLKRSSRKSDGRTPHSAFDMNGFAAKHGRKHQEEVMIQGADRKFMKPY